MTPKVADQTVPLNAASVTLQAKVTYTGVQAPSGVPSFNVDGGTSTAGSCTGSSSPLSCSVSYATGGLTQGHHTINVSLASDANYAAATGSGNLSVQSSPSIAWNPGTTKSYEGFALGAGVLNASSTTAGTFSYTALYPGSTSPTAIFASTVLPLGVSALTANLTPTDTTSYSNATASIAFTVLPQTVFIANMTGSVTSLLDTGALLANGSGGGFGVAVDANGFVWSIQSSGSGLARFTDRGMLASTFSGPGGMANAKALAIDGNSIVWIANAPGSLAAVTSTGTPFLSAPVATSGNISAPTALTIDSAGSIWITNSGNNTVTKVIGVAAPVAAPVVLQVRTATFATRP